MASEVMSLVRESTCKIEESNYTFGFLHGVKSTFGISTEKMPKFLKRYCEMASEDEKESGVEVDDRLYGLNIGEELTRKTSAIVCTFFFRFNLNKEELENINLFDENFIKAIVFSFQRAMAELLNISAEMREFTTVILETPTWTQKNTTCFIIELRFPYCVVDRIVQKTKLKTEVMNNLRRNNAFTYLAVQPMDDWEDIIQENGNFLPLYRSCIDASLPPHNLRNIYSVMDNIDDGDAEKQLEDVFDPMTHTYLREEEITPDFLDEDEEDDIDKWIPLFLSAYFWNKVTTLKTRKSPESNKGNYYENTEDLDDLSLARIFIDMIKPTTINQENYWLDIGKVLYKITKGSEEGLELFINVSTANKRNKSKKGKNKVDEKEEKENNHDRDHCKLVWPTLKSYNLTLKTLAYMAKTDNSLEYREWHAAWVEPAIEMALDEMTEEDMADAVYRFFWLDFICSNMKSSTWWYFTNETHRLIQMDSAFKLRKGISEKVIPLLRAMQLETMRKIQSLGSAKGHKGEEKSLETRIGQISSLIKKFKTKTTKDKVIDFCKEKFYVENFKRLTKTGGLITAWPNCVVEICGKKAIPRPGKLEDYLTKAGIVPYHPEFNWDHPTVVDCMEYLGQVFPEEQLLHYALKDFASYLKGKNAEKLFRVWTGEGDNSKSMLIKLMQLWLGELCIDLPDTVYTGGGKKGGGPTPELAQADGAHLAVTCEPDDGDDLKAGAIKKGTGGDRFFGRMCNQDGGSIDLTHKAIYMCNSIPNIPNVDKATKNRFGILPFLSTWTDDAPEDEDEQMRTRTFKKDVDFERKLPDLAEAMFWIAVNYFEKYTEEGLVPPEIVREYTSQHWADHDPYQAFITERMRKVKTKKDDKISANNSVTSSDLYPHFRNFFRAQYPHSQVPSGPQFRTQMIQRMGKQVDRRWIGWLVQDAV